MPPGSAQSLENGSREGGKATAGGVLLIWGGNWGTRFIDEEVEEI